MEGILYPRNWAVAVNKQGRITYVGKDMGIEVKDPMTLTTKNLMTREEALSKAKIVPNGTTFNMDNHLLEGAE